MDVKTRKGITLFGCCLIGSTFGVNLYFGNLLSYVFSYHYSVNGQSSSTDLTPEWVFAIYIAFFTLGLIVQEVAQSRRGIRFTTALGISAFVSGLCLSYFSLHSPSSLWAVIGTFCLLTGMGDGILIASILCFCAAWFRTRVGLATSLVYASSGVGGLFMNYVMTAFINPGNLSPDYHRGKLKVFAQASIIDRVPFAFLLIGGCSAATQVVGLLLLQTPPDHQPKESLFHGILKRKTVAKETTNGTPSNSDYCQISSVGNMDFDNHEKQEKASIFQPKLDIDSKIPGSVFSKESFYIVCYSSFVLGAAQVVGTTYYKLFGQLWIANDKFLAAIGSSSSVSMIFIRLGTGYLADKVGSKSALVWTLAICTIFQSVWYFSARTEWGYFLWTVILLSFQSNSYALFPIIVIHYFGREQSSTNLFLVNVCMLLAMLLCPPFISCLLHHLGWFWLFFAGSCLNFTSLIYTICRL